MKKKLRKPLIITLIVATVLTILYFCRHIIVSFFVASWCFFVLFFWSESPPPPPQIEYAEFPIELVYEIDGTEYEIKDTVICEYDDWEIAGQSTKKRVWKKRLESGKDEFVIYDNGKTKIYCEYLSAATYMGDYESEEYDENAELKFYLSHGGAHLRSTSTNELSKKYGITNIRFSPPEPIENSFS